MPQRVPAYGVLLLGTLISFPPRSTLQYNTQPRPNPRTDAPARQVLNLTIRSRLTLSLTHFTCWWWRFCCTVIRSTGHLVARGCESYVIVFVSLLVRSTDVICDTLHFLRSFSSVFPALF